MLSRFLLLLSLCGLLANPGSAGFADDTATKPALVVQIKSIDGLVADAKYLATLSGREEEAKQAEGMFKSLVGPKGLEGIDTKRPLGLYGFVDPHLMDSTAVLMLPIADDNAFLSLLAGLNVNATKEDDGAYLVAPGLAPVSIHFRFAHKYVYATARDKSAIAPDKLRDPAKVLPPGQNDTLFASFRVDQIPEVFKQLITSQAEVRLADLGDQKKEGESPVARAIRAQVFKEAARQLASVINDGGEMTLRLGVDRKSSELTAELTINGRPQSALANSIVAIGTTPSLFAGLVKPDAAVNAVVHGALPESLQQSLGKALDDGFREALQKEKDKNKRMQQELIYKALSPTLKAGELDAAVSVRGPKENKHYTVVAGVKLKEGKAVEETFRDLLKDVPRAERDKIKLDAETTGSAKIHRLDVQEAYDADARQRLGDNPVYVAFRPDAAFLALGEGGLSALKEALASKPADAQPLLIEISVARLAPLIATKDNTAPARAAQKAFGGADASRDQIRLSIEGGKALKLRVALQSAAVRFFSLMDKQSKGEPE
jgi:hypothetical protein